MKTFFNLLICVVASAGCSTGSGSSCGSKITALEAAFDKMVMIAEQTVSASADEYEQQRLALVRLGCLHEEALPLGLSAESRAYRVLFSHIVNMQIRYPYASMGPERRWKVCGDKQQLEQWKNLHQTYDQESFRSFFEADLPVEESAKDSRFPIVSNAIVRTMKKLQFENPRKTDTELFTLFSHSPIAISIALSMIQGSASAEQAQASALLAQMVSIRPSVTNSLIIRLQSTSDIGECQRLANDAVLVLPESAKLLSTITNKPSKLAVAVAIAGRDPKQTESLSVLMEFLSGEHGSVLSKEAEDLVKRAGAKSPALLELLPRRSTK